MRFSRVLLIWAAVTSVFSIDQEKTFRSERERFSVRYPSSWYPFDGNSGGLDVINFPPSKRVRGVILPQEGARITVFRKPAGMSTLERWIQTDVLHSRVESRRVLGGGAVSDGCTKMIEVRWKWEAGPEEYFQESAYYCVAKGGLYRISLTYWSDNPSGPELNELALKIARSLRAW